MGDARGGPPVPPGRAGGDREQLQGGRQPTDGALAYMRVAEAMAAEPHIAGEAFNFSTESPMTALQLVEMIQKTMGTAFAPDVRAVATNEIQEQSLSARKARERLGWSPTYDL